MYHWGKIVGLPLGYFIGGEAGALAGFVLGLVLDKTLIAFRTPEFTRLAPQQLVNLQKDFYIATFLVMGHVAGFSNRTEEQERCAAENVMDRMGLEGQMRKDAMRLFTQGRQPGFNLNETLYRFQTMASAQKHLREMFVEIQTYAAYADNRLAPEVRQLLLNICRVLDMGAAEFERIFSTVKSEKHAIGKRNAKIKNGKLDKAAIANAYTILHTSPMASNEEIKRAYRRLTSQHHPDKLVAKGLPEDMLKLAEEKIREIRDAYECIREARNF